MYVLRKEKLKVCVDEKVVEKQFDSFCKLIIKNTRLNINREEVYRNLHEKSFSELSINEFNSMSSFDSYNFESFDVDGISIENEILYDALLSLPQLKRKVVILRFFANMTDSEIGKNLGLPRTTVQSIRYSTMKTLKRYMEDSKKSYEDTRKN